MVQKTLLQDDLFEEILEGVNEGVAIVNSDGIIEKCNENFKTILQLSDENVIGTLVEEILPGHGEEKNKKYVVPLSDKKILIKRKIFTRENNGDLEIIYISEYYDFMEQKRKNEEVNALKEMYEAVLMSSENGIQIIDTQGKLVFCNPSHAKLDDLEIKEILGKHITEVYEIASEDSPILEAIKTGKPTNNNFVECTTKKGKQCNFAGNAAPLFSGNKLIGAATMVNNYAKVKEMVDKFLDLQVELGNNHNNDSQGSGQKKKVSFSYILGENEHLQESLKWAKMACVTESPVLIFGETGTGKEIFAQSIHTDSNRSDKPFLAINCAAIPDNLLEGILFGTVKGAFTGAVDRKGLFEQADGGTVFLDELNSMPLILQSKLLRVLEEKKVRRLGDKEEVSVDVRIISSCNVEPSEAIKKGQLRSDIFYRLAVIYFTIPPLQERMDDLDLLVKHFIKYYNNKFHKNILDINEQVASLFYKYDWPGNIRQLKHCIECAMNVVSLDDRFIEEFHIPKYLQIGSSEKKEFSDDNFNKNILLEMNRKNREHEKIIDALKRNKGNVTRAAADLDMSRQCLQYRMRKYNIEKTKYGKDI